MKKLDVRAGGGGEGSGAPPKGYDALFDGALDGGVVDDEWGGTPAPNQVAREPHGAWESSGDESARPERETMADQLKRRSFTLASSVVKLFRAGGSGRYDPAYDVVCKQVIRSATSTGANYRAVCRARSDREFYAKLCIVVEECDETVYWLALALNTDLRIDQDTARTLLKEAKELCRVFAKSRATVRKRLNKK